jgi:peptidoglycan/xylan/chitin deacetylase (PgdA/CDA1 family)
MTVPIPDKLVVLTFDDGTSSYHEIVAPILQEHDFGATFFITEGLLFTTDKYWYLTWEEIRGLHDDGFEIASHNGRHVDVTRQAPEQLHRDLELIERRCGEYGIPRPLTFAYPGGNTGQEMVDILSERGYRFARRGCAPEIPTEFEVDGVMLDRNGGPGIIYDPRVDHPLLIPSAGISGPEWTFEEFAAAAAQAHDGKIAVFTFHGVPDIHPHCSTEPAVFETWMAHLADGAYTVIAFRDLERYVDPAAGPADPFEPVERRLAAMANDAAAPTR